jgi:hypothetical protein
VSVDGTPPAGGGKLLLFRARPEDAAEAAVDAPATDRSGHLLTLAASGSPAAPAPASRPRRRTTAVLAVTAAGLLASGVAAYAGLLPVPAQGMAHSAIGAPAPLARPQAEPAPGANLLEPASAGSRARGAGQVAAAPPTSAPGPEVDTPAVYGLCLAFDRAVQQQDDAASAKAFRNLARAAGGAANVQAYCAGTVPGSTR